MAHHRMPLNLAADPVPRELALLNKLLIEGRISSLVLVARTTDNQWLESYGLGLADGDTSASADPYALLGAIESIKRDVMRAYLTSTIEYVEIDEENDDE